MNEEKYAVWYSLSNNYEEIMNNFVVDDGGSKFERDFHLKNRFIDYDHAVIIWYGKQHGELGSLSRSDNPVLDEGFDFITYEVSRLLESQKIYKISFLFALPEFEYKGKVKDNGILFFAGHVGCERQNSSWLDDILNGM